MMLSRAASCSTQHAHTEGAARVKSDPKGHGRRISTDPCLLQKQAAASAGRMGVRNGGGARIHMPFSLLAFKMSEGGQLGRHSSHAGCARGEGSMWGSAFANRTM